MHLGLKQTLTVTLVALLISLPGWSEQGTVTDPKRIVSLAPSVTETLFALGAGEQLIGICTFCDFPREVARIDRIGSYLAPNVEAIVAKAPDVVIGVPPNSPEAVAALQRVGLKVVIVQVTRSSRLKRRCARLPMRLDVTPRVKRSWENCASTWLPCGHVWRARRNDAC